MHKKTGEYTARDGRRFGLTVGIAFLVLAAIVVWRGHAGPARGMAVLGGALAVSGLVIPRALRPVDAAWMKLAELLSKVTTPIFMGIVYYLVFTPVGLVRRALGAKPMTAQGSGSVWQKHVPHSDLTRQF